MTDKKQQAITIGIVAGLIVLVSVFFGIRLIFVNETLVGVLLLVIAFVIMVTTIIGIVIFNKTKNDNIIQSNYCQVTKIDNKEKEFEYIDGKRSDLTLNEINDIEELLEDDDLLR